MKILVTMECVAAECVDNFSIVNSIYNMLQIFKGIYMYMH